jgi:hypothetical protein
LKEERYIRAAMRSILFGIFSSPPMHVLVGDGHANDPTAQLVEDASVGSPQVRPFDTGSSLDGTEVPNYQQGLSCIALTLVCAG